METGNRYKPVPAFISVLERLFSHSYQHITALDAVTNQRTALRFSTTHQED